MRPASGARSLVFSPGKNEQKADAVISVGVPIEITGLVVSLGARPILHSVDLNVRAGEFLTLLGPSGSGKTTLLMAIAGFAMPDAGDIRIGSTDVTMLPPHRREVGVVFQSYALFPHMTVGENVAYPLRLRRTPRADVAARVERALALVQLDGFADRAIESLSGGQRQRVAVARAAVFRPRVLLMDEPLSALDKPLREAMQIELRRVHRELGLTTVYVTHDQREALTLSDRIAVIDDGRVAQIGTPEELYTRPKNAFVARFLGESTILPVEVSEGAVRYRGLDIRVADIAAGEGAKGLLIRPERLRPLPPGAPPPRDCNVFRGVVADTMFQGDSVRVEIVLPDGAVIALRSQYARRAGEPLPQRGEAIDVALAREDAILVSRNGA
jgi:putative spermidine/putrescine transport system ATP-binding protein